MIGLDKQNLQTWYDKGLEDLRYDYDLPEGGVILDIGAYEGEFVQRLICHQRNEEKGLWAVCVEPTDAIRGFGFAREIIRAAAGTKNGKMEMGGGAFATSIYEQENRREFEEIDTSELVFRLPPIALLKCNAEGSEYSIIPHLIETGAIERVQFLQIQFHTVENQPYQEWYNEIAEKLNNSHELMWDYPFVWQSWKKKL